MPSRRIRSSHSTFTRSAFTNDNDDGDDEKDGKTDREAVICAAKRRENKEKTDGRIKKKKREINWNTDIKNIIQMIQYMHTDIKNVIQYMHGFVPTFQNIFPLFLFSFSAVFFSFSIELLIIGL
jgi:hypothetical protein